MLLYLGAGRMNDGWRSLLAELTSATLYGRVWGCAAHRTILFPIVSVLVIGSVSFGAAHLFVPSGSLLELIWHSVGMLATLAVALSARFLSEMKTDLPIELLLPISTPVGDLSGLRVLAWQFDGPIAVALSIAVMHAAPAGRDAALLGAVAAAVSAWAGARRVGWRPSWSRWARSRRGMD
jgi:hypothetical protein